MPDKDPFEKIQPELQEGMSLSKCRKCGCMKETLEGLRSTLSSLQTMDSSDLTKNLDRWLQQMESIQYTCLGCDHCFPAVAMNVFYRAFPESSLAQPTSCVPQVTEQIWPPVPREYFVLGDGPSRPVAVSTLASGKLSEKLAGMRPKELSIVGRTETENIGIEKVIKNTITNPAIRFLLLAGKDPKGHRSGKTLLALWESGVDEKRRVIGSPGKRPVLRNVTGDEVQSFRKQVRVVDLIGCEDVDRVVEKIEGLQLELKPPGSCVECSGEAKSVRISTVPVIQSKKPAKVEMDKAGYFVIIPQREKGIITVEHYSHNNRLLRVIEGKEARSIYWTIIENEWVTQLSHAAYLGKELEKAELAIQMGFKYIQDGA